jgi:hypothetical protein
MKRERKKEKNIFTEIDKRYGRIHTVVSKLWPDGERFRRRCPNLVLARNLLARINGAIVAGTWKELRKELMETPEKLETGLTIREFADVYLEEYCKVRNTRPDFKEETLEVIKDIIGDVPLKDFQRSNAFYFEQVRNQQVSGATVNRGIAVLSNMLTFALRKGLIQYHPMQHYGRIPEKERALRIMELPEERRLVQAIFQP